MHSLRLSRIFYLLWNQSNSTVIATSTYQELYLKFTLNQVLRTWHIFSQWCYKIRSLFEACTLFRCWLKEGREKRGEGGRQKVNAYWSNTAALWAAWFSQMRERERGGYRLSACQLHEFLSIADQKCDPLLFISLLNFENARAICPKYHSGGTLCM